MKRKNTSKCNDDIEELEVEITRCNTFSLPFSSIKIPGTLLHQYSHRHSRLVFSLPFIPVISTALNVLVNIYVRNIDEVSEKDGSFRAQITFRQEWNDPRLIYSGKAPNEYGMNMRRNEMKLIYRFCN